MNKKKVTIYDIASKTNVSAVTVHRALTDKGRISPQTKEKIQKVADELGYKVNPAAQGLRRQTIKIGAILFCPIEEYADSIAEGIVSAGRELEKYNVSVDVKRIPYTSRPQCLDIAYRTIEEFAAADYNGVVLFLSSMMDEVSRLSALIKQLKQEKTMVFATVANDILKQDCQLHVGVNAYMAGMIAAELLAFSCRGKDVALLVTSETSPVNMEYINGFRAFAKEELFRSISVYEHFDHPKTVEEAVRKMFRENPDLSGIYMSTARSTIACRYIDRQLHPETTIITTDLLKETPRLLRAKVANATIFQEPFQQGERVINHLYGFITEKTGSGAHYIDPKILLSSNLEP